MTTTEPRAAYPLHLADPADYAAARQALQGAGFDERGVARRGALPEHATPADACDALAHLFLDERPLPRADARRLLGDGLDALCALGLLADDDGADAVRATALLYPLGDLHLASDLSRPGGEAPPDDVVYPALTDSTAHFLRTLPDDGCERLVELCAGTGVAALRGAAACAEAWATDVSARAAHFAEFNRRLNGKANVTVACGDAWDAVGGRTFDRVVAHPPYVAGADDAVFRDGGEDGETVTRRIVEGLPAHLRPGGALHCTCAVTDRVSAPFERRVRLWLGDAADRFDVFFFPSASHDAVAHFARRAADGLDDMAAFARRARTFRRLGIERIAYGSFVLRRLRDDEDRRPLTVRRRAPGARWEDLRRAMDVERALAEPGVADALASLPLAADPDVEYAVTRRVGDAAAASCHVRLAGPLAVDASVRPWVGTLLARARGDRPLTDVVRALREEGAAPAHDDDPAELPALVRAFDAAGVLRLACPDAPEAAGLPAHVRRALAYA